MSKAFQEGGSAVVIWESAVDEIQRFRAVCTERGRTVFEQHSFDRLGKEAWTHYEGTPREFVEAASILMIKQSQKA